MPASSQPSVRALAEPGAVYKIATITPRAPFMSPKGTVLTSHNLFVVNITSSNILSLLSHLTNTDI